MADSRIKPKILIVDNEPENIRVLSKILRDKYIIMAATGGEDAIELLFSGNIVCDLILLDIMMPGMDGYEVCARLKNRPDTKEIPVIFISALSNIENELKGFEAGAVDYIGKPFHQGIVEARVKTHIELKQYRNQLEKTYG